MVALPMHGAYSVMGEIYPAQPHAVILETSMTDSYALNHELPSDAITCGHDIVSFVHVC